MNKEATIQQILGLKTIAVVGLSPRAERPSNSVTRYMLAQGYTIIPVNPGHDEILGFPCYPNLKAIPQPVDIVDVFRQPQYTPAVAAEAVAIGAKAFWLQLGIVNDEAVTIAEAGGLLAVQNRCMKIEHQRLYL